MSRKDPDKDRQCSGELLARLCGILDVTQRSYAVASRLRDLDDEAVINLIKVVRERALMGDGDCGAVYNALLRSDMLDRVIGRSRMCRLVQAAQETCEFDVVSILMDIPQHQPADGNFQPFLDPALRETPLGARKALARKPDFKLIKRIARDQDHRVIQILLNNPKLTEIDVTRIAATRPTSPKVLEAIYDHPRWISRYSVKKVLVFNPHTPLSITLRLLAFMLAQDLEELCRNPGLCTEIAEQAQRIMKRKAVPCTEELSLEVVEDHTA